MVLVVLVVERGSCKTDKTRQDGSRVGVDGRNASVAIINIRMVESAI
jgi:hypothetical protein